MGPRLESRGEQLVSVGYRQLAGELQWGRGSKAAESFPLAQSSGLITYASMGPRLESRGERLGR